eukprot:3834077-Alexandrium_andersonii.AAC.1
MNGHWKPSAPKMTQRLGQFLIASQKLRDLLREIARKVLKNIELSGPLALRVLALLEHIVDHPAKQ